MAAHTHSRPPTPRPRPVPGRPGARPGRIAAALVGLGPVVGAALGAVLGAASGGYAGRPFAVVCVLSAVLATALVTRAGLWWAVPLAPVAVWAVAVLAELAWHTPAYQGTKGQAIGVAHGTVHAFPVMAVEVALMLVLVAVRALGARWGERRDGRRGGRSAHA